MDKVFREKDLRSMAPDQGPGLCPITHKEFHEFIKGKGFKGRNNYKLRDLKAMFGFKPMITGSPVTISSNELEPTRFDSMSKASTSTGIPYVMLLYAKRNSRNRELAMKRALAMKRRMHCRFCSNPPVTFHKIGIPKKACTMREQQLNEAERIRKVHN